MTQNEDDFENVKLSENIRHEWMDVTISNEPVSKISIKNTNSHVLSTSFDKNTELINNFDRFVAKKISRNETNVC